jgi:hypothetical protein
MSIVRRFLAVFGGTATALVLVAGVATAGAGSAVILGRVNSASHVTTLSSSRGVPLSLSAANGAAPLAVNSETKVRHLDADLVDGLDSTALQRRITGGCTAGSSVGGVSVTGALSCVHDPYSVTWQAVVGPDGTAAFKHTGIATSRNAPGDYTVTWTGFPGRAWPSCEGVGRDGVLVSVQSDADGSGSLRMSFNGADTTFACSLTELR